MTASRTGSLAGVKVLLAAGAKVNAKDSYRGQTALMWAVSENHADVAKLLVAAGADVNAQSTLFDFSFRKVAAGGPVRAPMPGLVVRVEVTVGQEVAAGTGLVVVEAMKMENELRAHSRGLVEQIHVEAGQRVEKGAPLVTLGPPKVAEPSS